MEISVKEPRLLPMNQGYALISITRVEVECKSNRSLTNIIERTKGGDRSTVRKREISINYNPKGDS